LSDKAVYWFVGVVVAAVFYVVAFRTGRMQPPKDWQETFVDVLLFPVLAMIWPVIAIGMFGLLVWNLMFG
jgi:hypothetical protein